MTAKNAVADDVLGRITRKLLDLLRRILEGSVETTRASFFIQRAIENPPTPKTPGPGEAGIYVLESYWCYDKANYDFATISLEWGGEPTWFFEDLLKEDISEDARGFLLRTLRRIYEAQIPDHGRRRMMRLYRVSYRNCLGNFEGSLGRPLRDLHFSLEPVCEFDEQGEPLPVGTL
ncbi:MAG: hypothetical protein PHO91_01605 [Patescibacteria group bacterium]|nr:hypothetical protein [Patescibacteria group bacterium]